MSEAPTHLPQLRCLGHQPASAELATDLRAIGELREAARERLWELLGPSLADPLPDVVNDLAARFCERHAVHASLVARIVRGARVVLRGSVLFGVDAAGLDADLDALLGPGSPAAALLRAGFDGAREMLLREAVHKSLAEHGTVLRGMDWRLDAIVASPYGAALQAQVFTLTLRVQRAGVAERITVQATPETLVQLHEQLGRLLQGAKRS